MAAVFHKNKRNSAGNSEKVVHHDPCSNNAIQTESSANNLKFFDVAFWPELIGSCGFTSCQPIDKPLKTGLLTTVIASILSHFFTVDTGHTPRNQDCFQKRDRPKSFICGEQMVNNATRPL